MAIWAAHALVRAAIAEAAATGRIRAVRAGTRKAARKTAREVELSKNEASRAGSSLARRSVNPKGEGQCSGKAGLDCWPARRSRSPRVPALASAQELTIFWAEWDPANYLQELVNEYTAETGVTVTVRRRRGRLPDQGLRRVQRQGRRLRHGRRRLASGSAPARPAATTST